MATAQLEVIPDMYYTCVQWDVENVVWLKVAIHTLIVVLGEVGVTRKVHIGPC